MLSRRATLLMSPVIALVLAVPVCAQSYPGGWGGRAGCRILAGRFVAIRGPV